MPEVDHAFPHRAECPWCEERLTPHTVNVSTTYDQGDTPLVTRKINMICYRCHTGVTFMIQSGDDPLGLLD